MKIRDIITEKDQSLGYATSQHGTNLHKQERRKGIKPGTPKWFQMWFARPFLTHETLPATKSKKR